MADNWDPLGGHLIDNEHSQPQQHHGAVESPAGEAKSPQPQPAPGAPRLLMELTPLGQLVCFAHGSVCSFSSTVLRAWLCSRFARNCNVARETASRKRDVRHGDRDFDLRHAVSATDGIACR